MGAMGIAGTFLPHEIIAWADVPPNAIAAVLVQLLAALLFGLGMANWMARGSLIGGIYNRPLAVANLAHFVIGMFALAKALIDGQRAGLIYVLAPIYIVFAIGFAIVLRRSPNPQ